MGCTTSSAALLAIALLAPLQAHALGMQRLSEDDMRRVAAQGLADRFLERVSRYAANGLAVEVLGDMSSLLNPLAGLTDAETRFEDAVFNPVYPAMLTDIDGSVLIRLPVSIGEVSIRTIHVRGANGASFGSVSTRDVSFNGTAIRVSRR